MGVFLTMPDRLSNRSLGEAQVQSISVKFSFGLHPVLRLKQVDFNAAGCRPISPHLPLWVAGCLESYVSA